MLLLSPNAARRRAGRGVPGVVLWTAVVVTAAAMGCDTLPLFGGGGFGAGADAIAYEAGALDATEPSPLPDVVDAARVAIEQLGYDRVDDDRAHVDEQSARIVARTASDDEVDIRLERRSFGRTHVRIRVGDFGDETLSRLILEKIQQALRG